MTLSVPFILPVNLLQTLPCVFYLELLEHRVVIGIGPVGSLKVLVQQQMSVKEKHSVVTWKLRLYKRGSDLTCKTNTTLPSFVKH